MRLTENKRHKKLFKKISDNSGFYTCDGFSESIDKVHISNSPSIKTPALNENYEYRLFGSWYIKSILNKKLLECK